MAGIGVIQNPWITSDGKSAYGLNAQVMAYGQNGKALGTFDGWNNVMQSGLYPFDPMRGRREKVGRGGRGRV